FSASLSQSWSFPGRRRPHEDCAHSLTLRAGRVPLGLRRAAFVQSEASGPQGTVVSGTSDAAREMPLDDQAAENSTRPQKILVAVGRSVSPRGIPAAPPAASTTA